MSGHSPGSPLNVGGGILTQGLESSSSLESESPLSSVISSAGGSCTSPFIFLSIKGHLLGMASCRAATSWSRIGVCPCGSGVSVMKPLWYLGFILVLERFSVFIFQDLGAFQQLEFNYII